MSHSLFACPVKTRLLKLRAMNPNPENSNTSEEFPYPSQKIALQPLEFQIDPAAARFQAQNSPGRPQNPKPMPVRVAIGDGELVDGSAVVTETKIVEAVVAGVDTGGGAAGVKTDDDVLELVVEDVEDVSLVEASDSVIGAMNGTEVDVTLICEVAEAEGGTMVMILVEVRGAGAGTVTTTVEVEVLAAGTEITTVEGTTVTVTTERGGMLV